MIIITKTGIKLIGTTLSNFIAKLTRIEEEAIGIRTTKSIIIKEAISIKRKRTYSTWKIKNMKMTITPTKIIKCTLQALQVQT
jgi:hypothetical protein